MAVRGISHFDLEIETVKSQAVNCPYNLSSIITFCFQLQILWLKVTVGKAKISRQRIYPPEQSLVFVQLVCL